MLSRPSCGLGMAEIHVSLVHKAALFCGVLLSLKPLLLDVSKKLGPSLFLPSLLQNFGFKPVEERRHFEGDG